MAAASEAVKALYGMDATEKMLQLQKTRNEFEGNLTLVVFPFVKAAKRPVRKLANTWYRTAMLSASSML